MRRPLDLKKLTFSLNTIRLVPQVLSNDHDLQQLRALMVSQLESDRAFAMAQALRRDEESALKRRRISSHHLTET